MQTVDINDLKNFEPSLHDNAYLANLPSMDVELSTILGAMVSRELPFVHMIRYLFERRVFTETQNFEIARMLEGKVPLAHPTVCKGTYALEVEKSARARKPDPFEKSWPEIMYDSMTTLFEARPAATENTIHAYLYSYLLHEDLANVRGICNCLSEEVTAKVLYRQSVTSLMLACYHAWRTWGKDEQDLFLTDLIAVVQNNAPAGSESDGYFITMAAPIVL
jgi:hypothetical protein